MKNVLLIIPKLSHGGIERVASNVSMNIKKYNQIVFSIMNQKERYNFAVEPYIVDRRLGRGFLGKLLVSFFRYYHLAKIKKNVDIALSFGERCNILNIITPRRVKKIISCHSVISIENDKKGYVGFIYSLLAKKLYRYADAVIAVSTAVKDDLVNNFNIPADKIYLIHNGVDIENIIFDTSLISTKIFKLVTTGRITYAKGHWYQLYIIAILKFKYNYKNVSLTIIGEDETGFHIGKLKELALKLDIYENVDFAGYYSEPYILMADADAFLLTSIFEGFAAVLIESLACGVPIFSTDSMGPRDIFDLSDEIKIGRLFSPISGNSKPTDTDMILLNEIAIAISKIFDGVDCYNKNDLRNFSKKFSVKAMAEKYESLFDEVML